MSRGRCACTVLPTTPRQKAAYAVVAAFFLVAGMAWAVNDPGVWYTAQTTVQSLSVTDSGPGEDVDQLYLKVSDAERLNQDFTELNTVTSNEQVGEQAYCLHVDSDGVIDHVQQAGTIEASETHVKFSLSNCLRVNAQAHLHPSGSLRMSDTDKETLVGNEAFQFMCIQGGLVSTRPGTDAGNMACYEPLGDDVSDGFDQISVKIVED